MITCYIHGKVTDIYKKENGSVNVSVSRGDKHYDTVFGCPADVCVVGDEVAFDVRIRRYYKSDKNYGYFFIFSGVHDNKK